MTKTTHEKGSDLQRALLMAGVGNDAIPQQEARGQASFCESVDLPTECGNEEVLKSMGIKTGEPYKDDPIFRPVELPEGWKKQATDHSMWSDLVDDKGRKRAAIFYKAAFYDRSAHMDVVRRFAVLQNYDDCYGNKGLTHIQHRVLDCDKPVFETEKITVKNRKDGEEDFQHTDGIAKEQRSKCEDWLSKDYPEWEDPTMYWD
jgi:hypothetical protein